MGPDVRIDDGAEQGRDRARESTHPMRLRSASRPPATIQVSDSIESTEPLHLRALLALARRKVGW